jgi:hypothetical protein|tara:strand:- start:425 stop:733 length:309 start_codon:yes stop_codon:yes gene_type:complete
MASGDVVSDMYSVATNFQPAVGVSICITQFLTWNDTGTIVGKGDIDTGGYPLVFTIGNGSGNSDMRFWNGFVQKFFITNASYLEFKPNAGSPQYVGFLGIEI